MNSGNEDRNPQLSLQNVVCNYKIISLLLVVVGGILSFSAITLVPYHNVIELPQYWYEIMFPSVFGYLTVLVYYHLLCCRTILEFPDLLLPKAMISIFLTTVVTAISIFIISYLLWTVYLGYNSPLPFISYIAAYLSWIQLMIRIWYQFPKRLRQDTVFRGRLKSYYYYLACVFTVEIQFIGIQVFIRIVSQESQWITSIIFAWVRGMNSHVQERFICKAAGSNTLLAKGFLKMHIGIKFNSFVVILIGSKVNKVTSYCLLGTDFALNLLLCLKIIRIHQKVTPNIIENVNHRKIKEETLSELLLNELTEFITPVSFILAFSVAYYGPNAIIIGGIKNELWHYKRVEDILKYLNGSFQMILLDSISAIISFILLRIFCNINAFEECVKVIKRYGVLTTVFVIFITNTVSIF